MGSRASQRKALVLCAPSRRGIEGGAQSTPPYPGGWSLPDRQSLRLHLRKHTVTMTFMSVPTRLETSEGETMPVHLEVPQASLGCCTEEEHRKHDMMDGWMGGWMDKWVDKRMGG